MRVGGLFTGIGAHHEVAKTIPGLDVVFQSEIDERTARTYDMMHGETPNLGDVTKIENLDATPVELLYVSPPCQDISRQGKRAGLGENTRSGLIYEIPRIVGATKSENRPRIIIWEDVPDLVNNVYLPEWKKIEREMAKIGYRTKWDILNAYDYGIPQSRKRFYAISRYDTKEIVFPQKEPLFSNVRDYLEDEVDECHYLTSKRLKNLVETSKHSSFKFLPTDADRYVRTIVTREGAFQKGNNYLVVEKEINVLGSLDLKGWNESICRVYDPDRCAPTVTGQYSTHVAKFCMNDTRVRRLTPHECFRLQGFSDESFSRISELPMTFLYKLAGNSICVAPLRAITIEVLNPTADQPSLDYWM